MLIKKVVKYLLISIKNNPLLNRIARYLLYCILRLLFYTYRLTITYDQAIETPLKKNQGIFYFWHQNIIGGMFFFFKSKNTGHCIISPSNDGKIAGFICKQLGFDVLYGSSYKSSIQVLRSALRVLKNAHQLCVVGDGSRGPAFKLQKGITFLAAKSHLPLIFVDCKISHAFTLKKSWDRFKIPLPFSLITIHLHKPQYSQLSPPDLHKKNTLAE